jgi:hypothetical protein
MVSTMSSLGRFESFLEQMVEGSIARFFRSQIQPSEIARRLERAMESQQTISVSRVIVPNLYRAFLNPQDFAVVEAIKVSLEREMANYLVDLARERGFTMVEHPRVEISADTAVPRRVIQVVAETVASGPGVPESTQVMQMPAVPRADKRAQAAAYLLLQAADGQRRIPLDSTLLHIGRGLDNDIILEDSRVSRTHAQLVYRARRFYIGDAGSTNGTFVNGERVGERALRDRDVISLGGLELTFREEGVGR